MDATALINGISYAWCSITANIGGYIPAGISAIDYEEKREMENIYGIGSKPVARGYGNETFTGKITISKDELSIIQSQLGSSLTRVAPFDIVIVYAQESRLCTTTLKYCQFLGVKQGAKQGDKKLDVELDLVIGDITQEVVN